MNVTIIDKNTNTIINVAVFNSLESAKNMYPPPAYQCIPTERKPHYPRAKIIGHFLKAPSRELVNISVDPDNPILVLSPIIPDIDLTQ